MPTSRRRKTRKRQRPQVRQHPYETLIRGVQDDERLGHWYRRALWSFHRGPLPTQPDEHLQNAAMARALEWFLFDLRLPGSGATATEMWIDDQTRRHEWSDAVRHRYRRFTRGEYGLFEVRRAPLPVLFLDELGTGRRVHAVSTEGLVPEEGDVIAARLFPLEDDRAASRSPVVLELSPGSDIVFEEDREVVERLAGADALEVEALFGASASWIANAIGDRALAKVADHFFTGITGGSLRAEMVQRELRATDDPAGLIADVLSEVDLLTPQEPALFAMLVGAFWLGLHVDDGTFEGGREHSIDGWIRRLATLAPAPGAPLVRAPLEPIDDEAFHLSEHEAARVRALPDTPGSEWVGCRVQMRTPIAEPGRLPYYPDGVFWVDRQSGMIVGATVVHPQAPPSSVLRALVDSVLDPVAPATPQRPSCVSVGSRTLAARLAPVLSPLGISVGLRYVDPALGLALAEIETRTTSEEADEDAGGMAAPGSGGYLDLPGSTPERVGRFFEASARFYRAAPWEVLADDRWIEMEIPGLTSAGERSAGESILSAIAVVMGNGRQTFGLALYFDRVDLDTLMRSADPSVAMELDSLAVTFDAERDMEPAVVAETRAHGWTVAGRRAYPSGLRTQPDAPPRLIAGGELDLATAALDAVREFFTRHEEALRSPEARCTDRVEVEQVGTVRLTLEPEVLGEV